MITRMPIHPLVSDYIVIVKNLDDFPDPIGGKIYLENKYYILDAQIITPYSLVLPTSGNVFLSSNLVGTTNLIYTGSGAAIEGNPAANTFQYIFLISIILTQTNAKMFDVTGKTSTALILERVILIGSTGASLGNIYNLRFTIRFSQALNFASGIVLTNCDSTNISDGSAFLNWQNAANTKMISLYGTSSRAVQINEIQINLGSNEYAIYIDPDYYTPSGQILNLGISGYTQNVLAPESKDQTDIYWRFSDIGSISDSTSKAREIIIANTLTTEIITRSTPTDIIATRTCSNIEERFVFQDICTFNNITDVITTAFSHGMSNGDKITFYTISGTLPTGITTGKTYYLRDVTSTTFKISLTLGGVAIDFTTNGTGTNYYRHTTGVTPIGWIVYTGLELISVAINGWIRMTGKSSNDVVHANLNILDESGNVSVYEQGSWIEVSSSLSASSLITSVVEISTNKGFITSVTNESNTDDVKVTDSRINIHKI